MFMIYISSNNMSKYYNVSNMGRWGWRREKGVGINDNMKHMYTVTYLQVSHQYIVVKHKQ